MTEDWPAELQDVWESAVHDLSWRTYSQFGEYGIELFEEGWMDLTLSPEDREAARDAFFTLMSDFDLHVEHFDWDSWRDWYE